MWEMIKNDPILKTVTVIILGVLGFGFAFNIMFGVRGNSMDGGEMSSGGYSLDNTLSYILLIGFKLLLIAAVIYGLIAVVKVMNKYLFQGGEINMNNSIKNDSILKTVITITLALVALLIIFGLFGAIMGSGNGGMYGMMGSNGGFMMGGGAIYGFSLTSVLVIVLKILLLLSIIGLVTGVVVYLYQNYSKSIGDKVQTIIPKVSNITCPNCNSRVSSEFKFCPICGSVTKQNCKECGEELKAEWKCCPNCGAEKENKEQD